MTSSSDDYVYSLDLHFDPFVHLHQKLSQRSMNRSELQRNMIDAIVDGMDMEMLCTLACDALSATYDEYSDEELKNEVEEYYPHLLED